MNQYNYFNNESTSTYHTLETSSMFKRPKFQNNISNNPSFDINQMVKNEENKFKLYKNFNKSNRKQLSAASLNSNNSSTTPSYYRNLHYNLNTQSNELPYITNKYHTNNNTLNNKNLANNNIVSSFLSSSRNDKLRDVIIFPNPLKTIDVENKSPIIKKSSKSSTKIIGNKICQSNENFFNVYKAVRNIKKLVASPENYNLNNDNSNFHNIAYTKKHEDVVFDANKLLNKYKLKNQVTLEKSESSVNTFLSRNKEVSINNLLIKLIRSESNKIYSKTESRGRQLIENQKSLEINEQNFNTYNDVQKAACKQIDKMLTKLQKKNRALVEEERNKIAELKTKQDDIKRVLTQIDKFRIFGKFVNSVLGEDSKIFENPIYPNYYDHDDFDLILKNVFEKYDCFLKNSNNPVFEKVKLIMNDPDNLTQKFKEVEANIIRVLKIKEDTKKIVNQKEEENICLDNLKKRCMDLQKEYDNFKEIYQEELKKYYDVNLKADNAENNNYEKMIIELYLYINQNFKNNSSKNNKNNKNNKSSQENSERSSINKISVFDSIKDIKIFLTEKEKIVVDLIAKLSDYEKNDPETFLDALNYKKLADRILIKTNKLKQLRDKSGGSGEYDNYYKIIFINRKTEAPFHKPKKEKKIIHIDKTVVQEEENDALIEYPDE